MKIIRKFLMIVLIAAAAALSTGCHFEQLPGPPGLPPPPPVPVPGR